MTFFVPKRNVILGILIFNTASEAAVRGEWNTNHETKRDEPSQGRMQRQLGFILPEAPLQPEWTPRQSVPEVNYYHQHRSSNQRHMMNEKEKTSMQMDMNMGKKDMSKNEMGGKKVRAYPFPPEGLLEREWIPRQSVPEVYVHHHHRSSNMKNERMNMDMGKGGMGKKGMTNTISPAPSLETNTPSSKPKGMQMGKKGISATQASQPFANRSTGKGSIGDSPIWNAPTGYSPTGDDSTVNGRTGDSPTESFPTGDEPTVDAPTGYFPTGEGPTADIRTASGPTPDGLVVIGSGSNENRYYDNAPLSRSFQNRIVGGVSADPNEFKFIASLSVGCGGSLIAPGIILTAAHCAGNIRTARIGSHKSNIGGVVKSVITECVHPNYQSSTTTNDYMLLKLDSPVDTNQYPLIQLNNNRAVPQTNQILTVIGFGATSEGGFSSTSLLKVNVPANSHQECNQQYGGSIVENVMFCAGEKKGGKDSCQGDSGGPIFEIRGGKPIQVGVVSFGEGCARPNRSGVYSRVSGAYDWIQTTMTKLNNGDTSGCQNGRPSRPVNKPVKNPTRRPSRTNPPTESPTEEPVAPVGSPAFMGSPTSDDGSGNDDDDGSGTDDDDSYLNSWSRL